MQVREVAQEEYEGILAGLVANPPIEQTVVWQAYESTIDGRSLWGYVAFEEDGRTVAVAALQQYETHGYRYLRAHHAPVWAVEPTAERESAALDALVAYVRGRDRRQVFIRLAVDNELPQTRPCLSTLPYDMTVVIDLSGSDDDILSRMKPRGRRDVRKALRESPVVCSDETELALESFADYYDVMRETGERDGFVPAPMSDYEDMIRLLGRDHCRVFAGRDGDRVVTWSIVTLSGKRATRYYGASRSETMRLHVTDKLVYFECCELAHMGLEEYDLMGIGSDFQPATLGLNEFKTKFAKEGVTHVAPDRDLPLQKGFYGALVRVKGLRERLRNR